MASEYVQVFTTTDSDQEADKLSESIIQGRFAACVQIVGPIRSRYWWEGKTETAEEWLLICKTAASRYGDLEAHVRANHTYDTPEITALPVTAGLPQYLSWIGEETSAGARA